MKPILGDIEEKFRFVIDAAWYEKDHTFAELVEYVRAHRNTAPNSVFRERRRYGWGCATMMWLILVANVWWSVESIKAICQCIADKGITFKPILNAVISLLFASLTIYIAYVILVQWFADRCEEKEEHKNATSEGNCHP